MSESNKPAGNDPVVQTDSRNVVDVLIDEPGDTTVRPRRPNVPRDIQPPRRPEPDPRDTPPSPS